MNNKQKLLTATAITGTIVSASAFTVFDYAICRRKKQPDVRKKEKWKPYLDYVLKEQEWLKEHQEQELKRDQIQRWINVACCLHSKRKCQRNHYLYARLPFNKRYRICTRSQISMESWIQHSPAMAKKPWKKRRPLHYLWSQGTPRPQTLDSVY